MKSENFELLNKEKEEGGGNPVPPEVTVKMYAENEIPAVVAYNAMRKAGLPAYLNEEAFNNAIKSKADELAKTQAGELAKDIATKQIDELFANSKGKLVRTINEIGITLDGDISKMKFNDVVEEVSKKIASFKKSGDTDEAKALTSQLENLKSEFAQTKAQNENASKVLSEKDAKIKELIETLSAKEQLYLTAQKENVLNKAFAKLDSSILSDDIPNEYKEQILELERRKIQSLIDDKFAFLLKDGKLVIKQKYIGADGSVTEIDPINEEDNKPYKNPFDALKSFVQKHSPKPAQAAQSAAKSSNSESKRYDPLKPNETAVDKWLKAIAEKGLQPHTKEAIAVKESFGLTLSENEKRALKK